MLLMANPIVNRPGIRLDLEFGKEVSNVKQFQHDQDDCNDTNYFNNTGAPGRKLGKLMQGSVIPHPSAIEP